MDKVFKAEKPDYVFHLAANSDIQASAQNPVIEYENTYSTTFHLLEAMRVNGVKKFFFASTSAVYGDKTCLLNEKTAELMPISYYGGAKLGSEGIISSYTYMNDMSVLMFRFPNVIGPRLTHGAVFDFMKRLRENPKELTILGDGHQTKPYIYVLDLVDAIMKFKDVGQGITLYNVGVEGATSVTRIAEIIVEKMGLKDVAFKYTGGRGGWKGDVPKFQYDLGKIHAAGWQAKYSSDENLNTPLVSVVMATFNEEPDMVTKAISSILCQTYSNLELFILDDSTKEETIHAIDNMSKDLRVKVVRKGNRMGFVPALNEGIRLSNGKYIARMDGDDFSLPERLELEVEYMEKNPNVAVLGGFINIMDENENITGERLYPANGKKLAVYRSPVAHPTVLMRSELAKNGFSYNEKLKKAEDLDLWLRYLVHGYKIHNLQTKVLNYRVPTNLANKRGREQFTTAFAIRKANFSWHYPLFSLLSFCAGFMLAHAPKTIFEKVYTKENSKVLRSGGGCKCRVIYRINLTTDFEEELVA